MLDRLTSTLDFQSEALALRAERQRVLAGNIANADTPGYVARDFDFAQALRRATAAAGSGGTGAPVVLRACAPGHIAPPPGTRATVELQYARPAQTNLDGNSVDMDRERAAFADNAVKYEATLRFLNGSVKTMLTAITGQ
ncbi:flagellar basal body rod protein FlgB [Schlegelella aquatica]|uniref:flagellar basal body rod protein FlgB n=1 Tax=Caldimonas aquatica TaxID=376175 RepID=UPI0037528A63